jgi:hypothetical protein
MKSFSIFRKEQLKSDRQLLPLAASCLGGADDPIMRQKQENSNFSRERKHSDSAKNLTDTSLIIRFNCSGCGVY